MLHTMWTATRDLFRGLLVLTGAFVFGFIASVGWHFAGMLF